MSHRFKVGQRVRLERSRLFNKAGSEYKIVQFAPDAGHGPQYRVKCTSEGFERMVLERDLAVDESIRSESEEITTAAFALRPLANREAGVRS